MEVAAAIEETPPPTSAESSHGHHITECNKDNDREEEEKDKISEKLENIPEKISKAKEIARQDTKKKKTREKVVLIDEPDSPNDDKVNKWDGKDPFEVLTDWHWKRVKDSDRDSLERIRTPRKKKMISNYYQINKITNYYPRVANPRRMANLPSTSKNYRSPCDIVDATEKDDAEDLEESDSAVADTEATETFAADSAAADIAAQTVAAEAEAAEIEAADTEVADTETVDTEVADTEETDTDVANTKETDTEVADTEAADAEAADPVTTEIGAAVTETEDTVAADTSSANIVAAGNLEMGLPAPINSSDPRRPSMDEPRPSTSCFKPTYSQKC